MKKMFVMMIAVLLAMQVAAKTEQVEIQGAVGKLSAVIRTPDHWKGEQLPMVIVCHGFTGNKEARLLQEVADSLLAHGMAAILFDFNGHGKSEGAFENMTVLNEIEDAKKVYEYVCRLPYVDGVAMVGHSQGGVVTAMTAECCVMMHCVAIFLVRCITHTTFRSEPMSMVTCGWEGSMHAWHRPCLSTRRPDCMRVLPISSMELMTP